MEPELVFKALGDLSRRRLLDMLHAKDGQSLTELESQFEITRFGVMKHLRILQDAGLVTTQKHGRETLHYLNTVPIQHVYDRWVSKYAARWASSLTELKYDLEADKMEDTHMTQHIFVIYIETTPEKLWQAITDGRMTSKYYFGTSVESDWKEGSDYRYLDHEANVLVDGTVIESDPPRRLVTTFNPRWGEEVTSDFPESRVSYEIEQLGEVCKLTLTHSDLAVGNSLTEGFFDGWSQILSGLKTLLETGSPLAVERHEQVQGGRKNVT